MVGEITLYHINLFAHHYKNPQITRFLAVDGISPYVILKYEQGES